MCPVSTAGRTLVKFGGWPNQV
ncbi:hypothetical protein E2C01_078192 [Portunus trituberculatus]|uniref:Uncharacterized protein n=1 Tax=Portunus trituberculatus TaxID=210409 RepID=A0A5B7IGB8_PORTR|nr:hypothetical protein [Portunus trituberculatus]